MIVRYTTKMHAEASKLLKTLPKKYTSLYSIQERVKNMQSADVSKEDLDSFIMEKNSLEEGIQLFKKMLGSIVSIGSQFS